MIALTAIRKFALFSMAELFGLTVGMMLGSSRDITGGAVVNVVVPLVSGYIAYIIAKDLAVEIKVFVPGAVSALMLNLVLAFWYARFAFTPPQE